MGRVGMTRIDSRDLDIVFRLSIADFHSICGFVRRYLLINSVGSVWYLFGGEIFVDFRPMNCGDKWPVSPSSTFSMENSLRNVGIRMICGSQTLHL
jgi:hypothetical protein